MKNKSFQKLLKKMQTE